MFKLIALLAALIPVFLFLRAVFGRSPAVKKAAADFRRQIDYLVWGTLIFVACVVVVSLVHLFLPAWR